MIETGSNDMCSENDDPTTYDAPRAIGGGRRRSDPEFWASFWTRVDKSGDCWLWTAGTNEPEGYGRMTRPGEFPKKSYAHRLSWERAYGPIPDGLWVLHHCDTPRCVRPDHLFLGTNADNVADSRSKGRGPTGETNGQSKLTAADVEAIRASAEYQYVLADRYGVSQSLISRVQSGSSWATGYRPSGPQPKPACQRLVFIRGEDRRCGVERGLVRWTDHTSVLHWACSSHVAGMKKRHPESLPERAPVHGTLGLSSPWARGAFGPADVIEIENAIPPGYVVGVSGHRTNALVWVIDPEGREVTRWVNQPDAVWAARQAVAFIRRAAVPA